jgi:hypothetical protein
MLGQDDQSNIITRKLHAIKKVIGKTAKEVIREKKRVRNEELV